MTEYTMERLRRATRLDNIPFDKDMIPIITELNEKGYKTLACCQGHLKKSNNRWCGYLLFDRPYQFEIEPPLYRIGVKYHSLVGSYSEVSKNKKAYYWIGSRSKKMTLEEKESERKKWINDLYKWAKELKRA